MTKNIEGTVDDDIAAKLAIGEGRQVRISMSGRCHVSGCFAGWLVDSRGV